MFSNLRNIKYPVLISTIVIIIIIIISKLK